MKYTEKQSTALKIFNDPSFIYYLCYGGSRSGKSWVICKYLILKSLKYAGTRHLICRQSKTSCYSTVWTQTLLGILANYDKRLWDEDKSNRIIKFYNGSEIRAGGFDNTQHEDAVLGSEYASIFVNEAIDLHYPIFEKLISRLNWKGVQLKFFLDCNPKAPSHWVSKWFMKQISPSDNEPITDKLKAKVTSIHFHPLDNKKNLNNDYLEQLESLKGLAKKRFWDGEWAEDIEGLVYHAFERKVNVVESKIEMQLEAETFTTWDFGTADPTFIIVGQIIQVQKSSDHPLGVIINIIDEHENKNQDVSHYGKWCQSRPWFNVNRRDYGDPAGAARGATLKSWISMLWQFGIQVQYTSSYSVSEYIDSANHVIPYVRICEKDCPKTVEMFENWKYPIDNNGQKKVDSLPEHNKYSHPGTSFYYFTGNRLGAKRGQLIV